MKTTITDLKDSIKKIYKLSESGKYVAVMTWGAPGVGKSAIIRQAAKELEIDFIDLRLSLLNPVDLRGLPSIDKEKNKAHWVIPDFLPNGSHGKKGILFLDEINLAPQSVMSAGYQLILDRRLGDYKVPAGWIIVAAGNRAEDNGQVTKFPAPLANRFVHYEVSNPEQKEWKKWAVKNGVNEHIVTFLDKMPQHLYEFPKAGEKAWKSPRSWEFASMLYSIGEAIDPAVGEGVASEFNAFIKIYKNMPDINAILEGKEAKLTSEMTKKLDLMFALSNAIIYNAKAEHIENVFSYISNMPKEFEVRTIIGMADKNDEMKTALTQSESWEKWYKNSPEELFN